MNGVQCTVYSVLVLGPQAGGATHRRLIPLSHVDDKAWTVGQEARGESPALASTTSPRVLVAYHPPAIYLKSSMTDKFDVIETKVGIRVYLSDEPGFAGVVKARYSDFIVHEGKGEST
jgi:hypothetical protein